MNKEKVAATVAFCLEKIDENKSFKFKGLKNIDTIDGIVDIADDLIDIIKKFKDDEGLVQEDALEVVAEVISNFINVGKIGKIPLIGKLIRKHFKKILKKIATVVVGLIYKGKI